MHRRHLCTMPLISSADADVLPLLDMWDVTVAVCCGDVHKSLKQIWINALYAVSFSHMLLENSLKEPESLLHVYNPTSSLAIFLARATIARTPETFIPIDLVRSSSKRTVAAQWNTMFTW